MNQYLLRSMNYMPVHIYTSHQWLDDLGVHYRVAYQSEISQFIAYYAIGLIHPLP